MPHRAAELEKCAHWLQELTRAREAVLVDTEAACQGDVLDPHSVPHMCVEARQGGKGVDRPCRVAAKVDGLVPRFLDVLEQERDKNRADFFGERTVALFLARVAHAFEQYWETLHGFGFGSAQIPGHL